jgi:hypothetical protein
LGGDEDAPGEGTRPTKAADAAFSAFVFNRIPMPDLWWSANLAN